MKCLNCGEWFAEQGGNQKYCSAACGEKYRRKHPVKTRYPSITFTCAKCGKEVVTDGIRDKRTRFCSQTCERRYWRHPPNEHSALRTMSARYSEWYDKKILED